MATAAPGATGPGAPERSLPACGGAGPRAVRLSIRPSTVLRALRFDGAHRPERVEGRLSKGNPKSAISPPPPRAPQAPRTAGGCRPHLAVGGTPTVIPRLPRRSLPLSAVHHSMRQPGVVPGNVNNRDEDGFVIRRFRPHPPSASFRCSLFGTSLGLPPSPLCARSLPALGGRPLDFARGKPLRLNHPPSEQISCQRHGPARHASTPFHVIRGFSRFLRGRCEVIRGFLRANPCTESLRTGLFFRFSPSRSAPNPLGAPKTRFDPPKNAPIPGFPAKIIFRNFPPGPP